MTAPCDEDPILCAGLLCACVDPNQHFETDLLGMQHAGTMNCDNGKCQMNSSYSNSMDMQVADDYDGVEYYDDDQYGGGWDE